MGWMQTWFCMWGNSGAVGLRLREEPRPYCRAAKRGVSERVRFPIEVGMGHYCPTPPSEPDRRISRIRLASR